MADEIEEEIKRLRAKQDDNRRATRRANAGLILEWLVAKVGESPDKISVATLERLLLDAPCDLFFSGRDQNRWGKNAARKNEISFCVMIPSSEGSWEGSTGAGATVVEAIRAAIIELRAVVGNQ